MMELFNFLSLSQEKSQNFGLRELDFDAES